MCPYVCVSGCGGVFFVLRFVCCVSECLRVNEHLTFTEGSAYSSIGNQKSRGSSKGNSFQVSPSYQTPAYSTKACTS